MIAVNGGARNPTNFSPSVSSQSISQSVPTRKERKKEGFVVFLHLQHDVATKPRGGEDTTVRTYTAESSWSRLYRLWKGIICCTKAPSLTDTFAYKSDMCVITGDSRGEVVVS